MSVSKSVKLRACAISGVLLLGACTVMPTGPSVMVLPGTGQSFEHFRDDDAMCRQYAYYQIGGKSADQAAKQSAVTSAVVGTAVGAAAGAAIGGGREGAAVGAGTGLLLGSAVVGTAVGAVAGAAIGGGREGAAVGAGTGLLLGSAVGSDAARSSGVGTQNQYDNAYIQCMYSKGHRVPVPGNMSYSRPLRANDAGIPPPPPGAPPPPPTR